MIRKIILSSILVVLSCIFFASSALAHGTGTTSQHSATTSNSPQICYDLADAGGNWLPQEECNNTLVAPAGGITGIGIRLQGVDSSRHVNYLAWAGTKFLGEKKDGDKLFDDKNPLNPITQINIQLAPRAGSSVSILAIDGNFNIINKHDNEDVGNNTATAPALRALQLHYKS